MSISKQVNVFIANERPQYAYSHKNKTSSSNKSRLTAAFEDFNVKYGYKSGSARYQSCTSLFETTAQKYPKRK
jgi:predicted secreted protein